MSTIKALPFKSYAEVIAAFKAGAKFEVVGDAHSSGRVIAITFEGAGMRVRTAAPGSQGWVGFDAGGTHRSYAGVHLVLVEEAQRTPDFSLSRLADGEVFVNPKTGEEVDSVFIAGKTVEVVFVGGRTSTNYRANGTHRHDSARDLAPRPKSKAMRVEIAQSHDGTFRAVVNVAATFRPKREVGALVGLGQRIVFVNEFELPA